MPKPWPRSLVKAMAPVEPGYAARAGSPYPANAITPAASKAPKNPATIFPYDLVFLFIAILRIQVILPVVPLIPARPAFTARPPRAPRPPPGHARGNGRGSPRAFLSGRGRRRSGPARGATAPPGETRCGTAWRLP